MTRYSTLLFVLLAGSGCAQRPTQSEAQAQNLEESQAQVKTVSDIQIGGPCEGCEAALEYGDRQLTWIDTLDNFSSKGPKIEVSGTIYMNDGKTTAKDIILYIYHTDQTGVYPTCGGEKDWSRRHGHLRTWLKTNAKGQYKFYTLRPGSYPQGRNPAHIHATIKEPGKSPYWIDDFLFDDDPFLTKEQRGYIDGRGGKTGVLSNGIMADGVMKYTRDITLGLNVEGWR